MRLPAENIALAIWYALIALGVVCIYLLSTAVVDAATLSMSGSCTGQGDTGMNFIYLDPPYPGQARKHYKMPEVDHVALIQEAITDYDGFALSTSSSALKDILELCPAHVRVAAWVKPFASFKPGVNPAYAWEPVIFHTPKKRSRTVKTVRDWHSANITLKKGLCGAKPESFCEWIISLLGLELEDTLEDRFPGTGIMSQTWESWRARALKEGTV